MPRGKRKENAVSVVNATTAARDANDAADAARERVIRKHDPQVEGLLDRLTPVELDSLYKTMLLKNRKQTREDALVIASLLETQLKIVGLPIEAANVSDIQGMLRDLVIK
jgi:hypothetical protein